MAVTLQAILNAAYPAYAATHRLPLRVHRAASVLRRCRTGDLGRTAVKCTAGHVLAVRRNSCRHRACPQCGWRHAEQWLKRWQARLLPTTHFQVVFTVPPALHILWQWNRKRFAGAFFQAARDTMFSLLAQERHLGARPGLLLALHTWGSALPIPASSPSAAAPSSFATASTAATSVPSRAPWSCPSRSFSTVCSSTFLSPDSRWCVPTVSMAGTSGRLSRLA